jgi:hypothetical protein
MSTSPAKTGVTRRKGGTPPVPYRWKPGQSGNPSGRPKGIRASLKELLREVVKTKDPKTGKLMPTTKQRMMLDTLYAEAIVGANPVRAFEAIRDTVDGRPVSSEDIDRADREQTPHVTVNLFQVLTTLPDEALAKLEQAAVEAEGVRELPEGDDDAA